MRTAVVGHTEWIEFGRVERVPGAGDIVHATDGWEEPGGGGAVAGVQLTRLAGSCTFYTALGDDERGAWSRQELEALGVRVESTVRDEPTRRAVVFIDDVGERTITTLGRRLEPTVADPLPWDELDDVDAVYFTAGDPGTLREARRARVLVATSRVADLLAETDVRLDAVVGSGTDPAEAFDPGALRHPPHLVVRTGGSRGGRYETRDGRTGAYHAVDPRGPIVDTYGAGDSFAAGLAFGLASGMDVNASLRLAARCGAWCVSGRGPYSRQLTAADLESSPGAAGSA
ncbi:MAG: PfkB family carbohydrate kinase [Actinobacteria bacterium]|nr:PfkB family carbohydrate kinase [Actinomycetota bacterium]